MDTKPFPQAKVKPENMDTQWFPQAKDKLENMDTQWFPHLKLVGKRGVTYEQSEDESQVYFKPSQFGRYVNSFHVKQIQTADDWFLLCLARLS